MARLEGKTIIVTGAGGFLASASAREMAAQDAAIVVADIDAKQAQATTDAIIAAGGKALAQTCDISEEPAVAAMVAAALDWTGRIDGLVNAAAAMNLFAQDRMLDAMTVETWDRAMAVNLRGTMLCCKHAIPTMIAHGGGAIVNFSSTAGLRGDIGLIAYSTSKAGLIGLSRSVATSYGKQGIRCNSLCPGSVWDETMKAALGPEALEIMTRTRMTPRLGEPADIAHMVAYLCSDESRYVTGQNFVVDGGGTTHQPWVHVTDARSV
jgi:NAD(P)-dependent dehydrogenase (short-subunit alcohol dehydrogenase family)